MICNEYFIRIECLVQEILIQVNLCSPPPPVNLCSSLRVVYVSSKDLICHSDNRYKMSKFNLSKGNGLFADILPLQEGFITLYQLYSLSRFCVCY